jgi:hypothetical protein
VRNPLITLAETAAGWARRDLSPDIEWATRRAVLDWFATTLPGCGELPAKLVLGALLSIAIVLSLLPVVASAARFINGRRHAGHGYGFLPGYQQPPNNSLPAYSRKASASRMARRNERPWYIDPVPSYYGYDGDWRYFGRPGFYGGRYNGGSLGPCWTRTPIGPIWNCG